MRYPKAQRAIVGEIHEIVGKDRPADVNRRMGRDTHWMGRILKLEKQIGLAEFIALAQEYGVRPSKALARIERRLKV